MAKVLALDLDGTLFYPKKKIKMIPKKNLLFIRKFIDQGNKVVLCSGRSMFYAKKVIEKINRDIDVIGCNSGFIYCNNEYVSESMLEAPLVGEVVKTLQEKFQIHVWLLMSKNCSLVIAGKLNKLQTIGYKIVYALQGVYAEKYCISNDVFMEEINKGHIYKLMMFFGLGKKGRQRAYEATKYLREFHNEQIEASWCDNFIELTARDVSKSNGLLKYCKLNSLKKEDVYVVGDSGNDISMFETFKEHSFCMEHASHKIKKFAKYHIDTVADIEKYIGE